MANLKTKLDLQGSKSVAKTPLAKWAPIASLLMLAVTIFYGAGASGGAEASTRVDQTNYTSFQAALRDQMHTGSELPQDSHEAPQESQGSNLLIALEIGVCIVLTSRLLVPKIGKLLEKRLNRVTTREVKPKTAAIQKKAVANVSNPKSATEPAKQGKAILDEFFKAAHYQLVSMLRAFAQISRLTDPAGREKLLGELGAEITSLKNRAGSLELTPAWHVASSIEKLLDELREKPSHITSPTLQTTGSALLLLKDLCLPGARKDLVTEPPGRFLVVDDDPVSGQAVSACLKKVAQTPDVAENGEAALKLAEGKTYDAIFMDVEMPGLDGFEVGAKIHELETNRTTPVVFVTSVENYESRTKSKTGKKTDLIAKPFLSSEITLKASVLLLRGRLDREKAGLKSSKSQSAVSPQSASEMRPAKVNPQSPEKGALAEPDQSASAPRREKANSVARDSDEARHFADNLRELQVQVSALSVTENTDLRQELLSEVYVGINMIRSDAANIGSKSVCEVSSALGKLVSKLLDIRDAEDIHRIQAIAAAIRLLEDLIQADMEPDLENSPIRALVVDDEPLARRALSNALQLTLQKPDIAENGQAALALTQSKPFDIIFLDIMMPDMDGFETCSKIRQTKLNADTPVIFVTSNNDAESRDKAFDCGGNGFITKPVLPAEIFLTALTSTLRARMGKNEIRTASARMLEDAVC